MIQEEYVAFETAKLLKEAGFPQYDIVGIISINGPRRNEKTESFVQPTQAKAMRWLREGKHISVEPGVTPSEQWCVYVWLFKAFEDIAAVDRYPTYEAAAEAGIQAACKYIIEKGGEQ